MSFELKKMISKEKFLLKYNHSEEQFEATGILWDELENIYNEHLNSEKELEHVANDIFGRLRNARKVHSVKYRIKDAEHVIDKIIRKCMNDPKRFINQHNYRTEIKDLIGLRVLHLYKEDWKAIHKEIIDNWEQVELPVAKHRPGDSEEFLDIYKKAGCQVEPHSAGYRSIHYIIKYNPTKKSYFAEIQVRTILEEAWSEIDHDIRYPNNGDNAIINGFIMILNRLVGSADELGSYIKHLSEEFEQKEMYFKDQIDKAVEKKNEEIKKIKQQIDQLEITIAQKEELINSISSIAKPEYTPAKINAKMVENFLTAIDDIRKNNPLLSPLPITTGLSDFSGIAKSIYSQNFENTSNKESSDDKGSGSETNKS